jgi:hypothetical protein
MKSILIQQADC